MKKIAKVLAIVVLGVLALGLFGGSEGCTKVEPTTTPPTIEATVVATQLAAPTVVQVAETPAATVESKYDEAWAHKQVEPGIKDMYELLLDHNWSKVYDMYPAEAREGCSRATFVTKSAGIMLLLDAFGFNDDFFKAELQDLKDGKLVLIFSEITKDRITYTTGDAEEPTTVIRENGEWVDPTAYEPLGQDCSSLDMDVGTGEETATAVPTVTSVPTVEPTVEPMPEPTIEPTVEPTVETQAPAQTCCKHCTAGKACGDSCISKDKTCTKPVGCACN